MVFDIKYIRLKLYILLHINIVYQKKIFVNFYFKLMICIEII